MALHDNKNGKSISVDTADKIKELITTKKIQEGLHNHLADQEISKKTLALAQLYEAINKHRIEMRKLKPDVSHFDEEGKLVSEHYSKNQMEALKKAKERLEKMENAFKKGYVDGEFKDVFELVQQLGSKDKGGGSKEDKGDNS